MSKSPRPTVREIKRLQAEVDRRQALVDSFEAACIERQGKIESLQRQLKEQLDVNEKVREQRNKAEYSVEAEMAKKFMATDEIVDYNLVDEELLREYALAMLEHRTDDSGDIESAIEKAATFKPHVQQQTFIDKDGRKRFRKNELVNQLVEQCGGHGLTGLNYVASIEASREDRAQLAQLIGYSVDGYLSLSYALPVQEDE